ncbi:MAG: nucleotidyl transferase AbiEii/AbiGii toxin family protein [Planctomycetes bacterium]|nr:nucleotidyl transferase AbiEii/AbiGii toxin family protein [Planctomycetota bacterium]
MNSVLRLTPGERRDLFVAAAQQLGFGATLIEKDFWVCWVLRELFALPGAREHLIFKGGTALSKIWRAIRRFSEDVDVSISREWLGFTGPFAPWQALSTSQRKKRMAALVAACGEKVRDELCPTLALRLTEELGEKGWELKSDPDDAQSLLFRYPSAFAEPREPAYIQRHVKIEGGARADPWPTEDQELQPYVAEAFPAGITDARVSVRALSIERTFWEKATILHAEAHRRKGKPAPERGSRHYADLAGLADHEACRHALERHDLRERVVAHKQIFFADKHAHYETAVPGTFRLLPDAYRMPDLERDYRDMREMFFEEPPPWAAVLARLGQLEDDINRLFAKG